jgi:hypothetical protein
MRSYSISEKEVIHNEGRVQKMRDDDKDIYDIRKQVRQGWCVYVCLHVCVCESRVLTEATDNNYYYYHCCHCYYYDYYYH